MAVETVDPEAIFPTTCGHSMDGHALTLVLRNPGGPAAVPYPAGILIDQGLGDKFLAEQLHPQHFEAACAQVGQPLLLRRHAGYDHGHWFIQSFVADHIAHHARQLGI